MSEQPVEVPGAEEEQYVDIVVCRGTVSKPGINAKTGRAFTVIPGDIITVPVRNNVDGVNPVRWWVQTGKGARTAEELEYLLQQRYDGRKGGPSGEEPRGDIERELPESIGVARRTPGGALGEPHDGYDDEIELDDE